MAPPQGLPRNGWANFFASLEPTCSLAPIAVLTKKRVAGWLLLPIRLSVCSSSHRDHSAHCARLLTVPFLGHHRERRV